MIRVLLAEDQAMMRGALAVLLDLEDDIEVVAQVADGTAIVPTALDVRPDVALLDIELPGASGLDAAAALARELPACRVVIVTTFGRPGYLQRAMAAGAVGFLVKDGPVEGLADAIRQVSRRRDRDRPRAGRGGAADRRRARSPRASATCWRPPRTGATVADIAAPAPPLREHGAQLPLRRDRQDRHPQQDRGGAARPAQRLALRRHSPPGPDTPVAMACTVVVPPLTCANASSVTQIKMIPPGLAPRPAAAYVSPLHLVVTPM